MKYKIEFKPRAVKDLRAINREDAKKILLKIRAMENDLAGDVSRLTDFEPQFRLRIGDYRALFNVEDDLVTIYRIKHRREVYK